jgi:type VI secretion system ImpB/VipA family protein
LATTFEFEFRGGDGARRREDRGTRLLLIGDFGARAQRGVAEPASLVRRPVGMVDVDSLDAAMARYAPQLDASLPDGTRVNLTFRSIDDLHPDQVANSHPPLAALMAMRRRLLDPATFSAAAAQLGAVGGGQANEPEDDRSTVSRLLGATPDRSGKGTAASAAIKAFVRQIAAGAGSAAALEFQPQYLAAVDAPATAELRAVLHAPAFQALESTWRSVHLLVSRLEFGDSLELYLFDTTLDELRADAAQADGDMSRCAFARRLRLLADEAADAEADWLLAAGLFDFGRADLELLDAIGAAALGAGIPFVGGADETLAGTCPDSSEWIPPAADLAGWQTLRGRRTAKAIGLVAPRMLLRLPYGSDTDAIDGFAFEELSSSPPANHELLWGCGSLAAMFVRAADAGTFDVDDLPALTFEEDGEQKLQSCAEWLMGERVADRLVDLGLIPLLGSRHRNAVRLVGLRSIA